MSRYCDVERELAHIRGAIGLLEQTREFFTNKTPVGDPAYWRARLHTIRERVDRDKALDHQMNELLARIERFQGRDACSEKADAPV